MVVTQLLADSPLATYSFLTNQWLLARYPSEGVLAPPHCGLFGQARKLDLEAVMRSSITPPYCLFRVRRRAVITAFVYQYT